MAGERTSSDSRSGFREELNRFAAVLLRAGVIDEASELEVRNHGAVAAARLQAARIDRSAPSAIDTLLALELRDARSGQPLSAAEIAATVAADQGMPFERIDPLKLDPEFVTKVLSKPFALRHQMVALREEDGHVVMAVARPFDEEGRDLARRTCAKPVRFVLALPEEIARVIREFYGFRSSVRRAAHAISVGGVDVQNLEQLVRVRGDKELEASDQHIINAVDYMFRYAFELNASDIHIEPRRQESVVRFRIDGVMHRVYTIPRNVHAALVSRIKILSRMDVAEKRRPQDGRIKTQMGDHTVEMRVSTLPVATGEKVVLRIFDPTTIHGDLGKLGFRSDELDLFYRWITQPHGIVLVTGPTGSGKSTTLYTALLNIADDRLNVVTIEDPIELIFDQLNQVAVQPQIGITFASALRTILRQDPDVIMVGEIRDSDTAEQAIQAALTGHLVFSTLHTNDAPTAIPRLIDLGCEPFLLSSALTGVMAQRLVRKVCEHCASDRLIPAEEFAALGGRVEGDVVSVRAGEGCPECRGTGYRGRVAIFEMMAITPAIRSAIEAGADIERLRELAVGGGMRNLRQAGLALVREGLTTIEEVLSVTADIAG